MKKIMNLSLVSMTHEKTAWYEISKGEKFYCPDEISGADQICSTKMYNDSVYLYQAIDDITIIHDDDNIGATSMRWYHGTPILWYPRLFLAHNGRDIDFANIFHDSKARALCKKASIKKICMPGNFSPVWYQDEILVPDFSMDGTNYYVCPAWILEKCANDENSH